MSSLVEKINKVRPLSRPTPRFCVARPFLFRQTMQQPIDNNLKAIKRCLYYSKQGEKALGIQRGSTLAKKMKTSGAKRIEKKPGKMVFRTLFLPFRRFPNERNGQIDGWAKAWIEVRPNGWMYISGRMNTFPFE